MPLRIRIFQNDQFIWLQLLFGVSFTCTYAHDDMISCRKHNVISLQFTA